MDAHAPVALAAGVAVLGFALLAAGGVIRSADTVYADSRWMWLSSLVGGLLFGVGMVLASGCGSKIWCAWARAT